MTLDRPGIDLAAVDSLSLSIDRGSIYEFPGPNGAGKTTTIHMLSTLTKPTPAAAQIAGHPLSDRDAVLSRVGYLPEDPPVYPELTGREQLAYWIEFRALDGSFCDRIDSLLRRFELSADADTDIHEYSKGVRQKPGIIGSILHDGRLVAKGTPDRLKRRIESSEEPTLEDAFLEIMIDTTVETSA